MGSYSFDSAYWHELIKFGKEVRESSLVDKSSYPIYHYTSDAAFCSILESEKLRFTNKRYLNDTTEGTYILDFCKENAEEICQDYLKYVKEFENACDKYKQKSKKFSLIEQYQCSFSIDSDSLCLWNYYTHGDSIRGCNIEFDNQALREGINKRYAGINYVYSGKVIYGKEAQISKIRKIANLYFDKYQQNKDNFFCDQFYETMRFLFDMLFFVGQFFKKDCFKVESEYRLFFDFVQREGSVYALEKLDDPDSKIMSKATPKLDLCFFARNGVVVPYIDVDFPPEALRSVMLSPTLDAEIAKRGVYTALRGKYYYNIKSMNDIKVSKIPVRF